MLSHTLLPLALAAVVAAQNRPDYNVNRPAPAPNADPHDTNNPRLVGKRFEFNELPLKVDTMETERGIQVGYNQCNVTTGGPNSMCQTMVVNSIDDFCIFIPPTVQPVGNAEAGMVAACTKPTHGARLIPQGALKGIQFLRTPSYVAIAGLIDGTLLNLPAGDAGGELDSGGQDGRGNPIGAMAYSTALPNSRGTLKQSAVWTQFIGASQFCMKLCDNADPNAMNLCEHVYDTIGCAQNMPAAYKDGVFESCDADNQIPVGRLVAENRFDIPASSNCVPAQSAEIYKDLPAPTGVSTTPTSTPTGNSQSAGNTGTRPPNGGNTNTRTSTGANPTNSNSSPGDAASARVSMIGVAAFLPVVAGLIGAYLV